MPPRLGRILRRPALLVALALAAPLAVPAALAGTVAAAPSATGPGATVPAARVAAAPDSRDLDVRADDGVRLRATISHPERIARRPTVVEFTPYGDLGRSFDVGRRYNYLLVQIRGTGDSGGSFDALGPRSQRDVVEVLRWACRRPFSDGRLAVTGFSASAIMMFNSWHRRLPCVEAAVLRSGTHELYRDLLVPGGISNLLPGVGVLGLIGTPAILQGGERLATDPLSVLGVAAGLFTAGINAGLAHPDLDGFWRRRGWRGSANDVPALLINGFFDVESRGSFQAYRSLRRDGAHLRLVGGHDGAPAGTDNGVRAAVDWLDHHVLGRANGVAREPRVRVLLSRGDREDYLRGDLVRRSGADWPLPSTRWRSLALSAASPGSRDGRLGGRVGPTTEQTYANLPSLPFMTDVPNAAIVGAAGLNALFDSAPALSEMDVADETGLTYRTPPLRRPLTAVGPAALRVRVATTTPGSAIWAVLSDVAPDGTVHPLTVGRLSTRFPRVVRSRSLLDRGRVVQPYGDFTTPRPPAIGQDRTYQVELWPVGNRFDVGHRVQLSIVGASAASLSLPGLSTVTVGRRSPSRLLLPVVPTR